MGLSHRQQLLQLYVTMVASRESDQVESELVNSGEANFLAASEGHEGSVILAPYLIPQDYLHCHYRDKALMLARGVSNAQFFLSALCKADSHSAGRQMVSHMSAPELNIMSIVGPVGNNALQAAGVAHIIKDQKSKPIVLCGIGDGTSQQGEVLEAIGESVRATLPVLYFIHDNALAISTRTQGKTFFSLPGDVKPDHFYNIPITYIDGVRPLEALTKMGEIVTSMRENRKPQIVVFRVDRLANHSNADNQKLYRPAEELQNSLAEHDPLKTSKAYLLSQGLTANDLSAAEKKANAQVRAAVETARQAAEPEPCFTAIRPLPKDLSRDAPENRGDFGESERYTMIQAMREVLRNHLAEDENVILLGEDLEDDKGDVFGVTKTLSTQFPGRVRNSALSESTIMGVSVGMALAGAHPVAFLQFADFIPLAYNQLIAEIGSMYWRTNGGWQCPVIVMAACGAYRPGLGPFHSQTNEATLCHIPGVDTYMLSNAADVAGILNAAFKSQRPSVILYPKKLLNNSGVDDTVAQDVENRLVPIGKARIVRPGQDITLIGWGNTVSICVEVAQELEVVGIDAEVIDLRTLKPYDLKTILASAEKTKHVIVSHEDNYACGLGAEILAAITEHAKVPVAVKRITRAETFIPCNFPNQLAVLPSFENLLEGAAQLLDLALSWEVTKPTDASQFYVEVIGSSPSDESVVITDIHVKVGDAIKAGDKLVDTEASKSSGEILAPCNGTVEKVFVSESEQVMVGENLLLLTLDQHISAAQVALKNVKKPLLRRKAAKTEEVQYATTTKMLHAVAISTPVFKTGSRKVSNRELLKNFPDHTNEDIIRRTGIENRFWLAESESPIVLAADITKELLQKHDLHLSDINAIICCTGTPFKHVSPSTSCLVLHQLYRYYGEQDIQAYDLNAACSGYIYGLQRAKDYLQSRPDERVLLLTVETLSTRLDKHDFATAFLFADAVSTTLVSGENHLNEAKALIEHTLISAHAESGVSLSVPTAPDSDEKIHMDDGRTIFNNAVKLMATATIKCCHQRGLDIHDLSLVVPHQANARIAKSIERRLALDDGTMYSNISRYGNTSANTIPIALSETLDTMDKDQYIGLCAFGGGFTYGAALLKVLPTR